MWNACFCKRWYIQNALIRRIILRDRAQSLVFNYQQSLSPKLFTDDFAWFQSFGNRERL